MAVAQDKTVAIEPVGVGWVVLQVIAPQGYGHVCHAHGRAGVTRVGLLHCVDRKRTDCTCHLLGICHVGSDSSWVRANGETVYFMAYPEKHCAGLGYALVMHGLHLTADLHHCRCAPLWLTDARELGQHCLNAVNSAGLQAVGELFHTFPATAHGPGGVTATVLLAESHLCVHTWPEQMAVTLDVYVCNFGGDHSAKAHALLATLITLFDPAHAEHNTLLRGQVMAA